MSLVGTRPPTVDEWDKYELHHRARLATKPGLTGMWQVSGRSNITDFEEVVKLDKQYISECGFWHTTCKTFIDDSCPLFTACFVCDLIHNITSWGYYLIGERLCHGTHGLPCALLQKQDLSFFWIYQKSFYDQSR